MPENWVRSTGRRNHASAEGVVKSVVGLKKNYTVVNEVKHTPLFLMTKGIFIPAWRTNWNAAITSSGFLTSIC
jgi:hypothetical protein